MDNFTDRPSRQNRDIQRFAIEDLASQLTEEWTQGKFSAEKWKDVLTWAQIFRNGGRSGYDLAKEIEPKLLAEPDSYLVEILEGACHHLDNIHTNAVKQWVKFHQHRLSRQLGDYVKTPWGVGKITELLPETAVYIVTPDNDPRYRQGGGWVLEAERCTTPEPNNNA